MDQKQVIVTAFKPCDNSKGSILTLFNSSETDVKTKLIQDKNPVQHVWLTNAGEDKIQEIGSDLKIAAWGVVMIRVEKE